MVQTKVAVAADKRRLTNDAVKAYVYGTPQTKFTSLFSSSADLSGARNQYTQQIVGNLDQGRGHAADLRVAAVGPGAAAAEPRRPRRRRRPSRPSRSPPANQQQAAATKATLSRSRASWPRRSHRRRWRRRSAGGRRRPSGERGRRRNGPPRPSQAAAAVADLVGGSASGAAATTAANQAAEARRTVSGAFAGHDRAGTAAVQAADSQLGVPYVWGGEQAGVGFDCSGLVQWAWAQAGVSIPRTTETQWPALPHVSLDALEPGDLLFYFNLDGDNQVDHVVMYVGSGPYGSDTVIQAPVHGRHRARTRRIFTEGLIGAGRP